MKLRPSDWSPASSLIRAIGLWVQGRIHLSREEVGLQWMDQGHRFTIIRHLFVDPPPGRPRRAEGVVIARFRLAERVARLAPWFSLLTMPFFIGLPGFVSKRWMLGDSGECRGYYHWATEADAKSYSESFAARFMMARALPGTGSVRWYPVADAPPMPRGGGEREPLVTGSGNSGRNRLKLFPSHVRG